LVFVSSWLPVVNPHPEQRLRFFLSALLEGLLGLRRIIVAPQPRQALRKLRNGERGVMRAAAEIIPDRTARRAQASITVEGGWQDQGYERDLVARVIDEARRYHLNDLRANEQNNMRSYRLPPFELKVYAANG